MGRAGLFLLDCVISERVVNRGWIANTTGSCFWCFVCYLCSFFWKGNWVICTVAFLHSYSFLPLDRHLGFVIVSTPRSSLTIDLHFTAISTVPILSLCVLFFFFFFFSYRTEYSINSELFLNLWSGVTFVLIISFVVGNKDTCSHCKKIHKPEETRMCPTHGERMDNHKGCHFSFVCLATCTLVMQPDGFSLWESLHVGLCYWCREPCKKKTASRMLKWKIFHCSILLMFF